MSARSQARIEARGVARSFGRIRALDDVSLTVRPGEVVAVTGPSGCGKSTLLALLGALDRPTAGELFWEGTEYGRGSESDRTRLRRSIGIVFQHPHMIRGLAVWENVTYPLVPHGATDTERRGRARELLERVGIVGRDEATPGELSGGELQRVGVARALVGKPEILLADEPTSDLDSETAAAIVSLFREQKEAGSSIVLATHDPALIELADQRLELSATI